MNIVRNHPGPKPGRVTRSWVISLLILMSCSPLLATTSEQSGSGARVLLLNSYHSQYKWTSDFVAGVRSALAGQIDEERLHIEFMDGRRFVDDPAHRKLLAELLRHKYSQLVPDLIIASDDFALDYLLERGEELFPQVPVVFGGINVTSPSRLDGLDHVTGVMEGMEIGGNIDLILRLQPSTRRIIMLADQTSFGRMMAVQAREEQISRRGSDVQLEIWDDFTLAGLKRRMERALPDDVFLMLAIHKDAGGEYFSYKQHMPELSAASSVPIYGMWGALMIGSGVTGGMMNDPLEHGRAVAAIAREVLNGKRPADIPIVRKARYSPQFDFRQLQRFSIDQTRLPLGSRTAFEPESFWGQYWPIATGALLLILFLVAVIAALLNSNLHRQRAEAKLRDLNAELEERVDARTSDLHDKNEELVRMSKQMKHWANTDSLTELPNRRRGLQLLRRHMIRTLADVGTLSLAVVDVDRFKTINDQHGHQTGDRVLREVAVRLGKTIRPSDFLCRWGGEEFLLVFPGMDRDGARAACERLRHLVSDDPIQPVERVTASFGLTQLQQGDSVESLVKRADDALYEAKGSGRDRVVVNG